MSPCAITFQLDSNAGYTMFRGSVKSTGYPLHSPVSPSLLLPCLTVCHHISTGLYICMWSYTQVDQSEREMNKVRCHLVALVKRRTESGRAPAVSGIGFPVDAV